MEMNSQLQSPAAFLESKETLVPIGQDPVSIWTLWKDETHCYRLEPHPILRSPSLVVATTVSQGGKGISLYFPALHTDMHFPPVNLDAFLRRGP
jgi:hypothetical protein